MTKHPKPSLDKDAATESKVCDLAKFLDPEKETLFCFELCDCLQFVLDSLELAFQ